MSDALDIQLGSQAGGGSSVEAEMANLFIYDQPMSAAQADSQHRALVWTYILPGEEEYNPTSTITITYDYDPLHRLTSALYSAGAEYVYTYDAVGNRQTMDSPEGQTSYTYDAGNRLTSVGGVAYTWDDNGKLTGDGLRSYSYDHANRLTEVTEGSLTTQFAYNGDGVRVAKTIEGETNDYVLDLLATLPVVISDTEAVYLYGLDIIAQQQAERLYYMHDGLGSVRQLLDSTGDIVTNYAYDPFGVPVVAGDVYNPYHYTGEAWDAEVELLYLRARYYQPEVGRFISKDPWRGRNVKPGSLHSYAYVGNNPTSATDPSGLEGPGPYFQGRARYEAPEYSAFESTGQALFLVAHNWFLEQGDEVVRLGPYLSLTQDVMHSPALVQFHQEWRAAAVTAGGQYPTPWHWRKHSIENRDEGPPPPRVIAGLFRYYVEHVKLGMCIYGLGSPTAEGPIDPVGATLGSFNLISAYPAEPGMVKIVAYNRTGWASATRIPGMRGEKLVGNRLRSKFGPGGTVHWFFYWWEPKPAPVGWSPYTY